ncbi:hypothetical protein LCGC14_1425470 [marine sediment metagenome]|uniref:Uncharacterized protein n=1 Tax=marine sediment metagenome TaxID=412755 RepID=A0A0F9JQK5_9ZZZZ
MESCHVVGADPELMLTSPNGQLVSAIGIVPGTKKHPHEVRGGAVQHDNVMSEFNVNPSNTLEEFTGNMRLVLGELAKLVAPNRLTVRASGHYPTTELDHDEARVFGCDPDFNSWTMRMNLFDNTKAMDSFRSAGGHWHVGYKDETKEMLEDDYGKAEVVKMLDIFQGVPSILLDPDETAPLRRSLYGRAGAHRPKPYGVEYRSLGNFWVQSPELVGLMYQLSDVAIRLCVEGESETIIKEADPRNVIRAINTSDKQMSRSVLDKVKKYLPTELFNRITQPIQANLYEAWQIAA